MDRPKSQKPQKPKATEATKATKAKNHKSQKPQKPKARSHEKQKKQKINKKTKINAPPKKNNMRLAGTRMYAACAASLRHLAQPADTSTRPAPPPVLNARSASSQHQHPGPQHQHRHPFESARSQLILICSNNPIAIPTWGITTYDLARICLCARKYTRKQQSP